jgi:hypothetical protein
MCDKYLLKTYIAFDPYDFIFRPLSFFKSKDTFLQINKPLSYTRAKELLREVLTQAVA